ncbi:MAG: DUF4292 domain-containing protein [Chlorobium sp.]|jgi:hypothetical protein|uniref:DUF4292 domain-containing protein n=1 Tax=Chlorobium sp. TaxID=1095 RepID=UPI001D62CA1B|nr:DUF4292 domain-containing protein [Chlorobium sp.]MBN1279543.1 DUF4292 domain-containing protein [Chlorobiaceae bacterium]MCF8215842.1 DUF4292 domain-containing protein [Chlorobium sp.]MCF8270740.1 DUF4292 domain-containing protein [Chlorobium sp.]MCF8287052.1 DUF4292 domain-containing protein [Chlorobium sp.]MCF8290709.1 DUF4292 domain-containing protein [Chlorobium sp.]
MKKFIVIFFAFLTLSLQYGCADFESITRDALPDRPSELTGELASLYRDVAEASPFIHSLDGYADVTIYTSGKRRERVYCNIQLARHKESRMIVSAGLLGWPVADLYFGKDSLFVHDMMSNRLLTGKNSEENIEKIIGVPSGYRMFSESLLGLVNLDDPIERVSRVKKGNGRVMYSFDRPGTIREMVVDPESRTLMALFQRNLYNDTATEIYFRKFQSFSVDGRTAQIPAQIEMVLFRDGESGDEEHRLVIDYDKRIINPEQLTIRYIRPKKARVISLDDIERLPWTRVSGER